MYRTVFGLCGRGRGWGDLVEWHWNMYIIICETDRQFRFDAWDKVLRASALGWPREVVWGGRWEQGSGLRTRVHPWWIHVDVWQNKYSIVKQNKVKFKKKIPPKRKCVWSTVISKDICLISYVYSQYCINHVFYSLYSDVPHIESCWSWSLVWPCWPWLTLTGLANS